MKKKATVEEATELKYQKDGYEICVNCLSITTVPTSLHIDYRKNYVEGVGQLCSECGKEY